jgi:hypothetical protein
MFNTVQLTFFVDIHNIFPLSVRTMLYRTNFLTLLWFRKENKTAMIKKIHQNLEKLIANYFE